ncbi:hypothetical protein LUZ60_012658 [Juncus effusus]|nr:hypothetical protein LUZ60_012658 [Juncus effusus]
MESPSSPSPAMEPPYRKQPSISPSPLHLSNYTSIPIRELLSPSPKRRAKSTRNQTQDENHEQVVSLTPRKKRRGRAASMVVAAATGFPGGCMNSSPRGVAVRRARRRLDKEIVEREKENGEEEEKVVKVRKKRQCKAKKVVERVVEAQIQKEDDLSLVPYVAPSKSETHFQDAFISNEETICGSGFFDLIYELIMWKNVAKSTLWFGFGSMFFFSTSFSRDFNFSIISSICHLSVLILGLAFIRDSIPQRQQVKSSAKLQLTEEDLLRVSKNLLPFFNAAISKAQMVFCGDPSTTLKVLPILLFGAKYGHLITVWRLIAAGFFISFTVPKLFSRYSQQINRGVESIKDRAIDSWKNCPRKKFVAASALTMFWNLFSIKTRIIAGFVSLVIFRYQSQQKNGEEANGENGEMQIDKDERLEMETN